MKLRESPIHTTTPVPFLPHAVRFKSSLDEKRGHSAGKSPTPLILARFPNLHCAETRTFGRVPTPLGQFLRSFLAHFRTSGHVSWSEAEALQGQQKVSGTQGPLRLSGTSPPPCPRFSLGRSTDIGGNHPLVTSHCSKSVSQHSPCQNVTIWLDVIPRGPGKAHAFAHFPTSSFPPVRVPALRGNADIGECGLFTPSRVLCHLPIRSAAFPR